MAEGVSETATHAQNGPSTTSSNVISATSDATISRAPIVKRTSPRPIWPTPRRTSRTRSRSPTVDGWAKGPTTRTSSSWERQIAGVIEMSRRCRVITMLRAKASVINSEKPIPSTPPLPGPPTMRPTPMSAIAMATPALAVTRSRSAIQASSAAAIGETACRKRTFATVEWLRATMKEPDAIAVQTATPRPAMPIERNAAIARPRSRTATKRASATNAKSARPASCVGVSTASSRWRPPAVDQATAAAAMYSCPRRRARRATSSGISPSCRGSAAPWDRTRL
jgi:hypothetical protein